MNQLNVNIMIIIGIIAVLMFAVDLNFKTGGYSVQDLRYPYISGSSDVCNVLSTILKTAPDQFALLMNALDSAFKSYQADAKTNTCTICKGANQPAECKDEKISRWVFNNCP